MALLCNFSDHLPSPCCCPRSPGAQEAPRLDLRGSLNTNVLILPLHPKPQSKKHLPSRMFRKPKTHISFSASVSSILEKISSAYSLPWNHSCEVSGILLILSFRQRKKYDSPLRVLGHLHLYNLLLLFLPVDFSKAGITDGFVQNM